MRWFKHLSTASNIEDISEMIELYGVESYGVWCIIQELVATQMDKTDKCSVRYSLRKWAKSCHISAKKFKKVVSFLSESGEISIEICENNTDFLKIKCSNLLNLRDEYSKKSRQPPDNIPTDSGETPDQDRETETETETELEKTKLFAEKAFEKYWLSYPKRNGRRIGKKEAKTKFLKIDQDKWNDLKAATVNYSDSLEKSGLSSMDAHRFLSDKWIDYIEEVEHSEKKQGSSNEIPKELR